MDFGGPRGGLDGRADGWTDGGTDGRTDTRILKIGRSVRWSVQRNKSKYTKILKILKITVKKKLVVFMKSVNDGVHEQ